MELKKIIDCLNVLNIRNGIEKEIAGISDNTKELKKNFLFIAKKGAKLDSHTYINAAIKQGACAIIHISSLNEYKKNISYIQISEPENYNDILVKICKIFYDYPDDKLKIIGITGTNGKTTITYLIKSIIEKSGNNCLLIGTIQVWLGKKKIAIDNTTPGPITLYRLYAEAVKKGIKYAVMEISSHAIHQRRLDISAVDIAVFTNLTQDHLDYHKNMEEYCSVKSLLFSSMNPEGSAIINTDDLYSEKMIEAAGKRSVIKFGIKNLTDIRGVIKKISIDTNIFEIISNRRKININAQLIGEHNVYNILAAFGAAQTLKIDEKKIIDGIEKMKTVDGRLEKVSNKKGLHIFVDYAHTPDALDNVLNCLNKLRVENKIITVFGCGGDRDKGKRPKMGKIAVTKSDYVIITSDNPRSEKPLDVIKNIVDGCCSYDNFDIEVDRRKGIERALAAAERGDIILIAGKGHETYQILADKTIDFDDRNVVKEILKQ